jgi:hypothetical protein
MRFSPSNNKDSHSQKYDHKTRGKEPKTMNTSVTNLTSSQAAVKKTVFLSPEKASRTCTNCALLHSKINGQRTSTEDLLIQQTMARKREISAKTFFNLQQGAWILNLRHATSPWKTRLQCFFKTQR